MIPQVWFGELRSLHLDHLAIGIRAKYICHLREQAFEIGNKTHIIPRSKDHIPTLRLFANFAFDHIPGETQRLKRACLCIAGLSTRQRVSLVKSSTLDCGERYQ